MERGGGAVDLLTAHRTVAETGSTNADLLALARDGVDEGTWLRAERQSAGRGRQGRSWASPVGNLYASTVVRLRAGDPPAATLALLAAVALAEAVTPLLPGVMLKWPNDLLLGGAKLAGILLERAGDAVVIGFGVNILHHPDLPDRQATSLAAHGVVIGAEAVLDLLAARLAAWLERWRDEGLAPVVRRWLSLAHSVGTPLSARLPDGSVVTGGFAGLDAGGALLLRTAAGEVETVHAGDVFAL